MHIGIGDCVCYSVRSNRFLIPLHTLKQHSFRANTKLLCLRPIPSCSRCRNSMHTHLAPNRAPIFKLPQSWLADRLHYVFCLPFATDRSPRDKHLFLFFTRFAHGWVFFCFITSVNMNLEAVLCCRCGNQIVLYMCIRHNTVATLHINSTDSSVMKAKFFALEPFSRSSFFKWINSRCHYGINGTY